MHAHFDNVLNSDWSPLGIILNFSKQLSVDPHDHLLFVDHLCVCYTHKSTTWFECDSNTLIYCSNSLEFDLISRSSVHNCITRSFDWSPHLIGPAHCASLKQLPYIHKQRRRRSRHIARVVLCANCWNLDRTFALHLRFQPIARAT